MTGLRYLLQEQLLPLNHDGAAGWITEDSLWLVVKRALDTLKEHLNNEKPYLKVVAKKAGQATHILDRFHLVAKLSKAIVEVRAQDVRQLKRDGVRAAYTHHARYLEERKKMVQWWADYLDTLKQQAEQPKVIVGRFGANTH